MVKIVVGANFGDEGKGLMTNYFSQGIDKGVIILSNGGAQRGHTVVDSGRRHVFRHFGSTFGNMNTYCTEDFVLNPIIYAKEIGEICYKNCHIPPRMLVNIRSNITTPLDMLANKIIEEHRKEKHGSCGLGIWETKRRHKQIPFYLIQCHLYPSFVDKIRDYYLDRFKDKGIELKGKYKDLFFDEDLQVAYMRDLLFMEKNCCIADNNILCDFTDIIFENGQGLLLDEDNKEYYPNLTASKTGAQKPLQMCKELGIKDKNIEVCYVTRTYLTRHGVGKMYSEVDKEKISREIGLDKTNFYNENQGALRYGFIDPAKLLQQIDSDIGDANVKKTISVTHCNEYYPDWVSEIADYVSFCEPYLTKKEFLYV